MFKVARSAASLFQHSPQSHLPRLKTNYMRILTKRRPTGGDLPNIVSVLFLDDAYIESSFLADY